MPASVSKIAGPRTQQLSWEEIAAKKRREIIGKIPSEWLLHPEIIQEARSRRSITGESIEGLLDEQTRSITVLDVPDLVESMRNGSRTAVQVVKAFGKRAAYAHQLGHYLLDVEFEQAISRANELDNYFKEHHELVGPLHGAPVTLKDQFHVRGMETTLGYVGWIGTFEGKTKDVNEESIESELVQELRLLGAIPIAKTTLVQSLWAPETNNNILGYAWNPHNQNLSTGGSSGGEGAIQALRGSAIGFGTDIGGSVSMPASFQGVFSLKPSTGRISFKGVANTGRGQEVMPTVVGIMGHSVEAITLVFKSLLSTEPWKRDPYALPIPWRGDLQFHPRKTPDYKPAFGFIAHNGIITPHPPIARALRMVKHALEEQGHQLVDWEGPSQKESIEIHGLIARGDGCADVYDAVQISGEPFVPEIQNLFPGGRPKPSISLSLFEAIVRHMKSYRERHLEYWMSTAKLTGDRPVEAIISPVTPYASVTPGNFKHSAYISSVNVLDCATVVIPVTFADKYVDVLDTNFQPLSEEDALNMMTYDPEVHHGAPASIQLIGKAKDEERLLSMAKLVVEALEKIRHPNQA